MQTRHALLLLLSLPLQAELRGDIDKFATRLLEVTGRTPGLSVAVVQGDAVTYAGAFGFRDVEAQAPVTSDTLFYVASSTKAFTAAAARLLANEGKLDLDAPLTKSLPRLKLTPPLDASRISVRDLLTHRPGFANGAVNFRTAFAGNIDRDGIFAVLEQSSTVAPIEFAYSNTSYIVAGLAMEHAAGTTWNELLATRVFAPLGMRATYAAMPPAGLPLAYGYVDDAHGRFRRLQSKQPETMHAAGGMFTTASDLARWVVEHVAGGRVLPRRVLRDLHAPQISLARRFGSIDRFAYSLGWYHGDYDGDLLVHHFGGYNGFYAHMSFMPERRLGVVVLSNGGGSVAEALASFIYDTLRGKGDAAKHETELARIRAEAEKQRAERAKVVARKLEHRLLTRLAESYAGEYRSSRLGVIVVRVRGGRVLAQMGAIRGELLPETGDAFLIDWLGDDSLEQVRFTFDAEGRATALDWEGRPFERVR